MCLILFLPRSIIGKYFHRTQEQLLFFSTTLVEHTTAASLSCAWTNGFFSRIASIKNAVDEEKRIEDCWQETSYIRFLLNAYRYFYGIIQI